MWPDQPLGRPLTGTEETLANLRRAEMLAYMRTNYVTGSTLIAAAGPVKHRKAVETLSGLGKRFRKAARRPFVPALSHQKEPRIRLFTKKTEQTQIALGIRTCSRHDERRFALRILNVILGENMSSRLFQVLREEHGLAYSICSSLSFWDDVGDLAISAGLETDRVEKSLRLITQELSRLVAKPPTAGEVRRARDYVIGQMDLSLENTENQMMWIGENLLGYGKVFTPEEVKNHLAEVTPGAVRAAARDFFRPERLSLALVSPMQRTKGLDAIFRRI
jgi:predicted Zn-dependent peptidase